MEVHNVQFKKHKQKLKNSIINIQIKWEKM